MTDRPQLFTRKCGTCIFRSGDPMLLGADRFREVVELNRAAGALLICHHTLDYGDRPDLGQTMCRGFWDAYADTSRVAQTMTGLFGPDWYTEIDPPHPEDPVPTPDAVPPLVGKLLQLTELHKLTDFGGDEPNRPSLGMNRPEDERQALIDALDDGEPHELSLVGRMAAAMYAHSVDGLAELADAPDGVRSRYYALARAGLDVVTTSALR